jgi:hypothetical protein
VSRGQGEKVEGNRVGKIPRVEEIVKYLREIKTKKWFQRSCYTLDNFFCNLQRNFVQKAFEDILVWESKISAEILVGDFARFSKDFKGY